MDKAPNHISQVQQEEFERFLLNQMELEEEITFNKKLDSNNQLKVQFEEFKALFFAVEEAGLRKALNDFHDTIPNERISKKRNFNRYRIAAGIALLMALGIWVFNRQSPNEKLFEEYFIPDPGLPTVMGSNSNYAFYEAMVDYKQGKYDVAIKKWGELRLQKPNNDTLNYFLGSAYLANGDEASAKKYLQLTIDQKQGTFINAAKYYLGLAYLKEGNGKKSVQVLKSLSDKRSQELVKGIQQ